jgi:hypothetical protein
MLEWSKPLRDESCCKIAFTLEAYYDETKKNWGYIQPLIT